MKCISLRARAIQSLRGTSIRTYTVVVRLCIITFVFMSNLLQLLFGFVNETRHDGFDRLNQVMSFQVDVLLFSSCWCIEGGVQLNKYSLKATSLPTQSQSTLRSRLQSTQHWQLPNKFRHCLPRIRSLKPCEWPTFVILKSNIVSCEVCASAFRICFKAGWFNIASIPVCQLCEICERAISLERRQRSMIIGAGFSTRSRLDAGTTSWPILMWLWWRCWIQIPCRIDRMDFPWRNCGSFLFHEAWQEI